MRKRKNRCSPIPLGSRERPGHLHIQRSPLLPGAYAHDEAHDLTAMPRHAAELLCRFDALFDFVEHEVGARPIYHF